MHLTSSVNWLGKYRRTWQIGKNKHNRARAQTQHKAFTQSCKKPHFRLNWIQRDSEKTFFSRLMFYSCVRLGTPAEENDFLSPLSRRTWKCHHLFGFRGVFGGAVAEGYGDALWSGLHSPLMILVRKTNTRSVMIYYSCVSFRWYAGPVEVESPPWEDQRQSLQAEGDRRFGDCQSRSTMRFSSQICSHCPAIS